MTMTICKIIYSEDALHKARIEGIKEGFREARVVVPDLTTLQYHREGTSMTRDGVQGVFCRDKYITVDDYLKTIKNPTSDDQSEVG